MPVVNLFYGFQRVDFGDGLVAPDADDTRKAESIAAGMAVTLLDSIEGHFKHDRRFNKAETAVILKRVLFEEFGHFGNFQIGQTGISFTDIQQLPIVMNSECVIGQHIAPAAVAEFNSGDDDVER